jgi:hypothetical protein
MMIKGILSLLVILPFTVFSQCPKWIGSSVDSALLLEKVSEKYLQVSLKKTIEKSNKSDYEFENSGCSCEFYFSVSKQRTEAKKTGKKHNLVSKIAIVGPEDKIKKMYTEYFYPLIKPCATTIQNTMLSYDKISVGYFSIPGNKKTAQINLHR